MPSVGFEPTLPCENKPLKLASLPKFLHDGLILKNMKIRIHELRALIKESLTTMMPSSYEEAKEMGQEALQKILANLVAEHNEAVAEQRAVVEKWEGFEKEYGRMLARYERGDVDDPEFYAMEKQANERAIELRPTAQKLKDISQKRYQITQWIKQVNKRPIDQQQAAMYGGDPNERPWGLGT